MTTTLRWSSSSTFSGGSSTRTGRRRPASSWMRIGGGGGVWRIHLRSGRGQGSPSYGLRQAAPASSAVHVGKGLVPELSPPERQGRIGGRVVTQSRKVAASGSCLCQ